VRSSASCRILRTTRVRGIANGRRISGTRCSNPDRPWVAVSRFATSATSGQRSLPPSHAPPLCLAGCTLGAATQELRQRRPRFLDEAIREESERRGGPGGGGVSCRLAIVAKVRFLPPEPDLCAIGRVARRQARDTSNRRFRERRPNPEADTAHACVVRRHVEVARRHLPPRRRRRPARRLHRGMLHRTAPLSWSGSSAAEEHRLVSRQAVPARA
jgi:hypothetical protein